MKRLLLISIAACALLAIPASACSPADPSARTKLTVACDATWPPFEIVNEQTKELDGFGPELMRAIAAKAGLDIELVNVGFDSLLAGISQCQYDMAVSSITITDDRKKTILFSDPYYAAGQIVTVRKDSAVTGKDDLGGKTVGGQIGTTGIGEANRITGATVKTYDDVGMAFQAMITGQLDAVIADNPVAQLYVNKNKDKLKTVGPVFTNEYFGIAICKKNAHLVPQINAALKALKDEGFLDSLSAKWIGQ
jgi:polar amino acid transport system substrate-binding protein